MKRIFFLLYSMNVGGVEKALLGLLSKIPFGQYDVHVGLFNKKGGFLDFLPKEVTVHEIDCYKDYWRFIQDPPLRGIRQMFKQGQLKDAIAFTFIYFQYKLTSNRYGFYKYILRKEPIFQETCDLAVSFSGPSVMSDYYISEKVKAKKKCAWIHFDVSQIDIDRKMTACLYEGFDKIFIVSETGKEIFDRMFPQFALKTEVFHNIVSLEQVLAMADKGPSFEDNYDGKRILTVGRISEEKGQQTAIEALKLLLDKGYQIKWYFVGDGKNRATCEQMAEDYGVSENVGFLGTQTNPYAYMRDCDLYVQPSRYEGFCITLAEALCFNRPIVATNFTGSTEQLSDRVNSVVVGMTAEDIVMGVIAALEKGALNKMESRSGNKDIFKFFDLLE